MNVWADTSDSELMRQISQGNRLAMTEVVSRYINPVKDFSMRIVGRRCDAEDITQEALFRLWRNAPSWKDKELPLRNWLYRITYNLCIDEIRKRKPETPIDEQLYLTTNTSVEKSIYNDEKYKLLAQALARLSEGQRTAIALCTYQGVANRDAASIMDISVDAVESLLSRGRRKLRETLVDIQGTLV